MKHTGLYGMMMLLACSLLSWFLIRLGGAWETFAQVLIACLTAVLGCYGVYHVIAASFKRPSRKCHVVHCSEKGNRYCDFVMYDSRTCGRPCCYQHIHMIDKREYCEGHYEQEGRP